MIENPKKQRVFFFGHEEEWRDIVYKNVKRDMYMISSFGRVYNKIRGAFLQPALHAYLSLQLQNNDNSRSTVSIHRLVATAFVHNPNPQEFNVVNHKDLNSLNNHYSNLEWCDEKYNVWHAIRNGAHMFPPIHIEQKGTWGDGHATKGEKNGMSRLKDYHIHAMCKALEEGKNYAEALIEAGLEVDDNNRFLISHIAQGTRWKHISCQYNIPETRKIEDYSQYIIPVCELLEKKLSASSIIDILKIEGCRDNLRGFINRIRRRKTYTDISKNYNW